MSIIISSPCPQRVWASCQVGNTRLGWFMTNHSRVTEPDTIGHQSIWMQPRAEEAMTEHCEDQTCSGVAVTVEQAEESPSSPSLSGDPSGTDTLSQGVVTAIQEAQGHKNSSDLFSQVQKLHVHNMDPPGVQSTQETSTVLACKQPTKMCDEASSWEGGTHSTKTRCCCISPTKAAVREAGPADHFPLLGAHLPLLAEHHHPLGDHHFPVDYHLPPLDDQAVCCSSYFHNANLNHTFAAYCHPQPIPAPAQVLPQGPPCTTQRAVEPPPVPGHLSLPFLISSIGEMDLDAKHLIQCRNLSCTWSSKPLPPPPPSGPLPPCQQSSMCCRSSAGQAPIPSRDIGTMTTITVLRDVAVQTGQITSSHVFPHICLADDNRSDTSAAKTLQSDQNKTSGSALKSPIREVKWDAEGMTWEVYGASVDPEELGLAIQKHLEQQIKETASRATKLAHQNTSSRQRGRLVASFRGPGCCSRRTTAKD